MAARGARQKLEGRRFSNWEVLELVEMKRGGAVYLCRCDCGAAKAVHYSNLVSGRTKSCGCQRSQRISHRMKRHGHASRAGGLASPTYSTWASMIQRCTNPKVRCWERYGGRGISVCPRWLESFENFLADMGEKPRKGMSIERLDSDGNYQPGNCVWASARTQNRNKTNTYLTPEIVQQLQSGVLSIEDAEATLGIKRNTLRAAASGQNWTDI